MKAAVWSLAWRNVARHRGRSLITVTAVAVGLAALLLLWGFNDGLHNAMIRTVQATFAGSLQIHHQGFFTQPQLETHIRSPEVVITALETVGVTQWAPRLQSSALAAGAQTSAGALLVGVDPRRERAVTHIATKVTKGRFLVAEDTYACVLGAVSADNLDLDLGDPVILLTQGRDGALAAERFTLVGIMSTGVSHIDQGMVLAPLVAVQEMLGMQGRLTNVAAIVPEARLEQVTVDLRRTLDEAGLEVMRWSDMFPVMRELVVVDNAFFYILLGVVLVIVVAGILNTVLVSMLERQREMGMLMALGTRSVAISAMVAVESLILSVTGLLVGSLMGLGLVSLFGRIGIDLSAMSDLLQRSFVDPVVYTEINTEHLLVTLLAMLVATLAAALYPAWRAVRLQPVEAIRHV